MIFHFPLYSRGPGFLESRAVWNPEFQESSTNPDQPGKRLGPIWDVGSQSFCTCPAKGTIGACFPHSSQNQKP